MNNTVHYTSTFLPIIFSVLIASLIYRFLEKRMSETRKNLVIPLLTLLVAFPFGILVAGPFETGWQNGFTEELWHCVDSRLF